MTLLMISGFDFEDDASWWINWAVQSTSTVTKRTGTHSKRAGNQTDSAAYRHHLDPGDWDETITVGCAFRTDVTGGNNYAYRLSFRSDSGTVLHITVVAHHVDRSLRIFRGSTTGTLLAQTDPYVWQPFTWHYLEVQVFVDDASGTVEVRQDGVTRLTYLGDTRNGGTTALVDSIGLSASESSGDITFLDDFYILNDQGAVNNTFLGDQRVYPLYPNGNGNYSQLVGSDANSTDNYLLVDEPGTPDDADYVGSATDGDQDTYTFEDMPVSVGTINGVEARIRAYKSDTGTKQMRALHRRAATDSAGADFTLPTTIPANFRELWELDPSDSAAWTISRVDDSEWGVEVRP